MATSARDVRRQVETFPPAPQFLEAIRRSDNLELITPAEFAAVLASIDLSGFDGGDLPGSSPEETRYTLTEGGELC